MRSLLEQLLVIIAACIPSVWFMYTYLNIPTKLFSIIIFMVLVSAIIFTYIFNKKIIVPINLKFPSPNLLVIIIYLICLLTVLLASPPSTGLVFNLGSLSQVGWLRVGSGLLLSLVLPGLAILSSFRHNLRPFLAILVSVLLSIFINSVVVFTATVLAQPVFLWIMLANITILCLKLFHIAGTKTRLHSLKQNIRLDIKLDNERILLILLLLFQASILFSVFLLSPFTVPNGDMWDHAAMATRLEENEFLRFGSLVYPPLFAFHLFSVSQLTGISTITISSLLGLANILTVLAFYVLVKIAAKKRAVAFISTLVSTLFGSFTFLVQAFLGKLVSNSQQLSTFFLETSGKTMQINSIYPFANIYAYAPVTLTLFSVLVLVALSLSKEKGQIVYVLEVLLLANLLLLHVAETLYVLIFLLAALVMGLSRAKDLFSMTLGAWIGAVVLLLLPYNESIISVYLAVAYSVALAFLCLNKKLKLQYRVGCLFKKGLRSILRPSKVTLASVILGLYILAFLLWVTLYIDGNESITPTLSYLGAAPLFFLPVVFGVPLFISIFYIARFLLAKETFDKNETRIVLFLLTSFIAAFLVGKGITVASLWGQVIYRELRIIQVFGGVAFSIFSGYAVYKIFLHFRRNKMTERKLLALGIGVLIFLGSGSTSVSATFWANTGMGAYSIKPEEAVALNYLKSKASASDVVLTYSLESTKKVELTGATTINRFSLPFSSVSSSIPKDFLQIVKYIYLSKDDYAALLKTNDYLASLVSTLPVLFNNSVATILSVPQIRNYISDSWVPVVVSGDLKNAISKLILLDYLGVSYRLFDLWDRTVFENSSVIILTEDIRDPSQAKTFLNWAENGGRLVILSQYEGYFSDMMDISVKTKIAFQESFTSEDSFSNWLFDLRYGLSMGNISINQDNKIAGRNSLMVNSTLGGIVGLAHPRTEQRVFPFAIGGWFMVTDNRSTMVNSLILGNSLSAGIGLWDGDYSIDYYYDGGKIKYDVAQISPGSWQKFELYFPDPQTCYVSLNDTLVFVGPRSTKYDSSLAPYMNEGNNTIYAYFTSKALVFWNGLYYRSPCQSEVNSLLCQESLVPFHSNYNLTSPKESTGINVQAISWYMNGTKKVAPLVFANQLGSGKLVYFDSQIPEREIQFLVNSSLPLLGSIDPSLPKYIREGGKSNLPLPIEIYGPQKLNGTLTINSSSINLKTANDTGKLEITDKNGQSLEADSIQLSSTNQLEFIVNGSATILPLHDEYVIMLIPANETVILTEQKENELSTWIYKENESLKVSNQSAFIRSKLPLIVSLKSPRIEVLGTTIFQKAFFDKPFNRIIGVGTGEITLNGNLAFNVIFSDETSDRTFGSEVSFVGSYAYSYPTILDIELPLNSLVNSPNVSIFVIFALIFLAFLTSILIFHKGKTLTLRKISDITNQTNNDATEEK